MPTSSSTVLTTFSNAVSAAAAAATPHVVSVHSHRSRASGFVWKPGLIVTADEALAAEGEVAVILSNGTSAAARIVGRDPSTDIALLRIERTDLAPARLETEAPTIATVALAIGAHKGAPVVSFGVVAVTGPAWRSMRGGEIEARIELDLSLRRHAEGGVAVDAGGRIFGMTAFGPRGRVLVIPSATVTRVAGQLEEHGRVPHGYLGLGLQAVRLDRHGGVGVMVMSVDPDGPGARAGVYQGDIMQEWDGQPISGLGALMHSLGPGAVGRTVALTLRRGGKPLEVSLTIGERPEG